MKKRSGFTLLEVMVVLLPLMLISYLGSDLIIAAVKKSLKLDQAQSTSFDFTIFLKSFLLHIRSTVPLSPAEGLYFANDHSYVGIAVIDRLSAPLKDVVDIYDTYCAPNPADGVFSIIRATYIDPNVQPLTLSRLYQYDNPPPPPKVPARTNVSRDSSLFIDSPSGVGEVVLTDPDQKYNARYKVTAAADCKNSISDPYADTVCDPTPGLNSWSDFTLGAPTYWNGDLTAQKLNFISKSGFLRTRTSIFCVSRDEVPSIVEINEADGALVSTYSFSKAIRIKNFEIKFGNLYQGHPFGISGNVNTYFPFSQIGPGLDKYHDVDCMNAVKLDFVAQDLDPKATVPIFRKTEFALLRNFTINRAAKCE